MKTVVIRNHTLKLYDAIDEMPIVNFQKYNKCLLLDAGIGSDIDSVDKHIINIAKYINSNNKEFAIQELQNMRQNMFMIVSNISPKYLAFAALIHSIDGKEQKDLSDDNLRDIIAMLNEAPFSWLVELLEVIKKKLTTELETYFPGDFDSTREKEAYSKLKMKIILQLEEIAEDEDNATEIDRIDDFLFNLHTPKKFIGKDSEEIKYDKQFESACLVISQKTGLKAKDLSVLEFYNTLAILKKQAEAEQKAYNKHQFKKN